MLALLDQNLALKSPADIPFPSTSSVFSFQISFPLGFTSCWKECSSAGLEKKRSTYRQAGREFPKHGADNAAAARNGAVVPLEDPPL